MPPRKRKTTPRKAADTAPETGPETAPETAEDKPAAVKGLGVDSGAEPPAPTAEAPLPTGLVATADGAGVLLDPTVGWAPVVPDVDDEQVVVTRGRSAMEAHAVGAVPADAGAAGSTVIEQAANVGARGADGRVYLPDADGPRGSDGQVRWAVTVIETKVPYSQRPTRGLLDTAEQCRERGYESLWRLIDPDDRREQRGAADAPDDDPAHPVGVQSWWRAKFTEAEVEQLRAAPNTVSVTYEHRVGPVGGQYDLSAGRNTAPTVVARL